MGQFIELTAADGFALRRGAPIPPARRAAAIVVAQEIFGVNSHIRSVCDGFAADGYVAIAPALFDRYERGVDIGYTPADIAKGRELKAQGADRRRAAATSPRRATRVAGAGKVAVIGYCWGGYVAWMAASRLPGFACAVPYYGGGMLDASGEQPALPGDGAFRRARRGDSGRRGARAAAAHPEAQIFIYAADHGFNCDQRAAYDAAAAKLARERTLEFLRRHLN